MRQELDIHVDTCPKRTFGCVDCEFRGTLAQVMDHVKTSESVKELKSDAEGKLVLALAIPHLAELRTDAIDIRVFWQALPERGLFVHVLASRFRLIIGLFTLSVRPVVGYEMILEHSASGTLHQGQVIFDGLERTRQCFPAFTLGSASWETIASQAGTVTLTFHRRRLTKKRKFAQAALDLSPLATQVAPAAAGSEPAAH